MSAYNEKVLLSGGAAIAVSLFGVLLLAISVAMVFGIPTSDIPWFGWALIGMCALGGFALVAWAACCHVRKAFWVFKADEERLSWFRSDRTGKIHER